MDKKMRLRLGNLLFHTATWWSWVLKYSWLQSPYEVSPLFQFLSYFACFLMQSNIQLSSYYCKVKERLAECMHACSVTKSCLTLCDPMDAPGPSVHGIPQPKILEWLVISSSRGSSQARARTHASCISCISRQILYHWATWEAPAYESIQ